MLSHKSDKDDMEGSWQAQVEYRTQEVKANERSTLCFGCDEPPLHAASELKEYLEKICRVRKHTGSSDSSVFFFVCSRFHCVLGSGKFSLNSRMEKERPETVLFFQFGTLLYETCRLLQNS